MGPELDPAIFLNLSNLKHLSIKYNFDLTRIGANTFTSLTNIETIELADNEISEIDPKAFSSLQTLRFLDLGSNKLTKFSFIDLPSNLEHLDLSFNLFNQFYFESIRVEIFKLVQERIDSDITRSVCESMQSPSARYTQKRLKSISASLFAATR
jgi:Leucine-rich repeat (LRR) protein